MEFQEINGRIWAENRAEGGLRVGMELPLVQARGL